VGDEGRTVRYRLDAKDKAEAERGLATLVLTVVELLRELMERQAIRRVEDGSVTDEQAERLGRTLMLLDERMDELVEKFGISRADLNLDLGPLGTLLPAGDRDADESGDGWGDGWVVDERPEMRNTP
jgi:hypothetical protein